MIFIKMNMLEKDFSKRVTELRIVKRIVKKHIPTLGRKNFAAKEGNTSTKRRTSAIGV